MIRFKTIKIPKLFRSLVILIVVLLLLTLFVRMVPKEKVQETMQFFLEKLDLKMMLSLQSPALSFGPPMEILANGDDFSETPKVLISSGEAEQEHDHYYELPFTEEELELMRQIGALQEEGANTAVKPTDGDTLYDNPKKDYEVLIYHTHTTESYFPTEQYYYVPMDKDSHSNDLDFSVVKVGRVMANALRKHEISVLHDITIHDIPNVVGVPYDKAYQTLKKVLAKNKKIQVVLDIHRDAVGSRENSREVYLTEIDGVKMSKFSIVIGKNHDGWEKNNAFAEKVQEIANERYPGLCRGIIQNERAKYNQVVSDKAILIEVGSYGNTLEESIETAKCLGEILAEAMKK